MKYMGSKRWMLGNSLGHLLVDRAVESDRFVDLFSGSGAVSWHVAERIDVPTMAVDLQTYSAVMARSVIERTQKLDPDILKNDWVDHAREVRTLQPLWGLVDALEPELIKCEDVELARQRCIEAKGIITRAYGGYYFSPEQALTADALLSCLPAQDPERSTCLAALIWSVGRCAASPGHTAQPFQPTDGALPFLREAWSKDLLAACTDVLPFIAGRAAQKRGVALVDDAVEVARQEINASDLVFLDPPYSAAQYSRFYHVLETVARGTCGEVSGVGRYPPASERPRSAFSLLSGANAAIADLLAVLGDVGCGVVMTFPQHGCSNGIVGEDLISLARRWFEVDITSVKMLHSTLGGNNSGRTARRSSVELILSLKPRRRVQGRSSRVV